MKRAILLLTILALVPIALVVAVLASEARFPAEAQTQLNRYMAKKLTSSSPVVHVQQIARARKPWNLSREMGFISFGDGVHFQTDYGYTEEERPSLKPLPFPPTDVWCVLLELGVRPSGSAKSQAQYTGVFVALHQDLYNADWAVHTGWKDLSMQEFMDSAAKIGCDVQRD
jgi:hypothetical protein